MPASNIAFRGFLRSAGHGQQRELAGWYLNMRKGAGGDRSDTLIHP